MGDLDFIALFSLSRKLFQSFRDGSWRCHLLVALEVLALPRDQFVASLYTALIDVLVWVVYN